MVPRAGSGPIPWSVPPLWRDATAVIAGGGPSFDEGQAALLRDVDIRRRCNVLAINDAGRRVAPSLLYFADHKWFAWHRDLVSALLTVGCPVATIDPAAAREDPRLKFLIRGDDTGLATAPNQLALGSNSGHQAVNLAYHLGARRILLVGFDMRVGPAPDGQGRPRTHWHAGHPVPTDPKVYERHMLPKWPPIAAALKQKGVEVVNCSPGSALTVFPVGDLAEELARSPSRQEVGAA